MADQMFEPGPVSGAEAPEGPLRFDCPRCGRATEATYWGPCGTCRDELAAGSEREGREAAVEAYAPKMNVVPNQVATKE